MTPWTVACQAPLSVEFTRQEYCIGCHFFLHGDLLDLGIEPESPALAGRFFATEPSGKPQLEILELACITDIFSSLPFFYIFYNEKLKILKYLMALYFHPFIDSRV